MSAFLGQVKFLGQVGSPPSVPPCCKVFWYDPKSVGIDKPGEWYMSCDVTTPGGYHSLYNAGPASPDVIAYYAKMCSQAVPAAPPPPPAQVPPAAPAATPSTGQVPQPPMIPQGTAIPANPTLAPGGPAFDIRSPIPLPPPAPVPATVPCDNVSEKPLREWMECLFFGRRLP